MCAVPLPVAKAAIENAPAGKTNADRRVIQRVATNIDGIYLTDAGEALCQLIDVSPTGAKLHFEEPQDIPEEFELYVPDFNLRYRVTSVWRTGHEISVRFEQCWRETR